MFFRTASVFQEEFESLFNSALPVFECAPSLVVAHFKGFIRLNFQQLGLFGSSKMWDDLSFHLFLALECSHHLLLLQSAGSALHYLQPAAALDPILLQPPHRNHRHHYCHHHQCRHRHHRHHRLHLVNDQWGKMCCRDPPWLSVISLPLHPSWHLL